MQRIDIIAVGKVKERFFTEAIHEYEKRIGRFARLDIIEVQDEKTPENASEAVNRQIREKEGERILKNIRGGRRYRFAFKDLPSYVRQSRR